MEKNIHLKKKKGIVCLYSHLKKKQIKVITLFILNCSLCWRSRSPMIIPISCSVISVLSKPSTKHFPSSDDFIKKLCLNVRARWRGFLLMCIHLTSRLSTSVLGVVATNFYLYLHTLCKRYFSHNFFYVLTYKLTANTFQI